MVLERFVYHYDCRNERLRGCPITSIVWKHKENNYFVHLKNVYTLQPKVVEEWRRQRLSYKYLKLDIGYWCIEKGACKKSTWNHRWSNQFLYIKCRKI